MNYVGFTLAFFLNVFEKLIMESCVPELVRMRTQKKMVTVWRIFSFCRYKLVSRCQVVIA